jgi:hypothetical protein
MLIQQNPFKIEEQVQQLHKLVLFVEKAARFYPIILLQNTTHNASVPVLTIPFTHRDASTTSTNSKEC